MAQPSPDDAHGVTMPGSPPSAHLAAAGKRKRDNGAASSNGDSMDVDVSVSVGVDVDRADDAPQPDREAAKGKELVTAFFEVLRRYALPASRTRPVTSSCRDAWAYPPPTRGVIDLHRVMGRQRERVKLTTT
jgi:hypothetical protein